MSNYILEYQQKLGSAAAAAASIKSGDHLCFLAAAGEPSLLVQALVDRKHELQGVVVNQNHPHSAAYFNQESAKHIKFNSWFCSSADRTAVQNGWADYVPNNFHEFPKLLTEYWPVDLMGTVVSSMDEDGFFTCGLYAGYAMAALKKAKKVVVQVNPNAPRTFGNCRIHVSKVDHIIECNDPIDEIPLPPITSLEESIGNYIAELVGDGATLQFGIGGIPNAVCKALLNKKNLGIHSELISDGMVDLIQAGAINNSRKNIDIGKSIGNFALGTKRLYDFIHNNPLIEMHPSDYTNDPYIIGKNDNVVAINSTIEVDLLGQCCSESFGHLQWSGTGGQLDYIRGANISKGGKSFITTASTAKTGTLSCIVPFLKPGAAVTTGKNDVDHVVTEFGVAKMRGQTARQRALNLINIAHPDFRGELIEAAKKMNRI